MNTMFQVKFAAKRFEREQSKCEKRMKAQKGLVKKAIAKGDRQSAAIYAQNAIREKNQGLSYLRMSSRLDAVTAKMNQALTMKKLTPQLSRVTHGMAGVLKSIDSAALSVTMDKFETLFDDMDVLVGGMERGMQGVTASTTPESQVDALINQVADEHNLAIESQMTAAPTGKVAAAVSANPVAAQPDEDALEQRLRQLRENPLAS